jgi:uncharacterized membrane protein
LTDTKGTRLGTRGFFVVLWGTLCTAILLAPACAACFHPTAAAFLYLLFAPVCHQLPHRSFFLAGHALAVCHRCSGIYLGLLLGALLPHSAYDRLLGPRRYGAVVCATVPLVVDAALDLAGVWANTPWSRFTTGLLFGTIASMLLVRGMEELRAGTSGLIAFRRPLDTGDSS